MTQEIFRCIYGSRLFGTNIATSDTDWKAIHIPSARDIIFGNAQRGLEDNAGSNKKKNSAADRDFTTYPLHRYLELLAAMDTVAVEMLFAKDMGTYSPVFEEVHNNRHRIMSGRPDKCIGYARSQITRYVLRGDRVQKLEDLVDALSSIGRHRVIEVDECMAQLRAMEDVLITVKEEQGGRNIPYMEAFGKEFQLTQRGREIAKMYKLELDAYGYRARQAQENAGVDWKGMYHAVRIIDQGLELSRTGEIAFPLANRGLYLKIRNGELPLEEVQETFEQRLEELRNISIHPSFAGEPDQQLIQDIVFEAYGQTVIDALKERQDNNLEQSGSSLPPQV